MSEDAAIPADSQPAAVDPSLEAAAPEGKADKGADSAPAKDDPNVTANGEKLDRQTRNWRALERDRDHWREMAMRQSPPPAPPQAEPKVEPSKPKTLADFNYDEAQYSAHLADHFAKQAEERALAAVEKRLREQDQRSSAARRQSEFATREAQFAKDVEDYYEATRDSSLPITQEIAEIVAESEDGPALAYYLAKNIDVTRRIAQLSPTAAARELGRIEARLGDERVKAKDAKTSVSKAPPPPPKVDAKGDATPKVAPDSPESDQLSTEEWFKARIKQVNRRK
jgi:hypothetical protein